MVQSKKVITLIAYTLMHAAVTRGAEPGWTLVRGAGYSVATDAGASAGVEMANRAEQLRRLLGGAAGVLPLRIVLAGSESLFSALRPSATVGGFYQSSADEDWIVVRWGRPDSERAMSHEIVHAYMEHSGPRRPLWLEEGLAEFYSTARLTAKGWTIGLPVVSHVQILNQGAWLGEREFFEVRPDSPLREEGARIGRFYAQSWAVVHYLLTTPGVREKAPALFRALGEGIPFAMACEATLGQRQGLLLEATRQAVERRRFATARMAADAQPLTSGPPQTLASSEADAMLFNLSLAVGRPELASRVARTPAQRGLLALSERDQGNAERLFGEAVAQNSPDAAPYFELAMLLRDDKREPERVTALLRSAIERNPNHAEAHFLLGLRAAAAGDDEGAIDYYQNAARILPRQANFWHALALALERTGRLAEAAHAAMRCRLAARNATEREMAAGLDRLVREQPAASVAPRRKPAENVPESWRGLHGDATAVGELVEFDCDVQPPIARVASDGQRLALRVEKPGAIRILGTDSTRHTLACGPQSLAVRVEYLRGSNELTAIEFR